MIIHSYAHLNVGDGGSATPHGFTTQKNATSNIAAVSTSNLENEIMNKSSITQK
jgi:hypothetical protein